VVKEALWRLQAERAAANALIRAELAATHAQALLDVDVGGGGGELSSELSSESRSSRRRVSVMESEMQEEIQRRVGKEKSKFEGRASAVKEANAAELEAAHKKSTAWKHSSAMEEWDISAANQLNCNKAIHMTEMEEEAAAR